VHSAYSPLHDTCASNENPHSVCRVITAHNLLDLRILLAPFDASARPRVHSSRGTPLNASWAAFISRETKAAASRVSERNRRIDAVCRLSLVPPPHGVAEAVCGVTDCGDRPRRRCVNEQPLPVDELGSDGTP
jgi:hypothetical protein